MRKRGKAEAPRGGEPSRSGGSGDRADDRGREGGDEVCEDAGGDRVGGREHDVVQGVRRGRGEGVCGDETGEYDDGEREKQGKRVRIEGVVMENEHRDEWFGARAGNGDCERNLDREEGDGEAAEKATKWVQEVSMAMNAEEENEDEGLEKVWDDVRGGMMRMDDVRRARREEIGYMQSKGIWKVVDVEECWRVTGKGPVGVRWVDTNKGTDDSPEVRSRLVARDFKTKEKREHEDLFAATPPIEAGRLVISKAATWGILPNGKKKLRKLMFIDAKKAHLNPYCEDNVYIELPEEAGVGVGKCGKLQHWIYGCRRAAQAWESYYSE